MNPDISPEDRAVLLEFLRQMKPVADVLRPELAADIEELLSKEDK
jgi:hypothetical protein